MLSPLNTPDMHSVVSDLIKAIVSMAAPSPRNLPATGPIAETMPAGPSSNRFARELVSEKNVLTLVGFMLDIVPLGNYDPNRVVAAPDLVAEELRKFVEGASSQASEETDESNQSLDEPTPLPNAESATSSLTHIISIFIELIRKNNSDYFEPYLFHTLRNRLIQVRETPVNMSNRGPVNGPEEERAALETAMDEMVRHLRIVHLGSFLTILSSRLRDILQLLRWPRSLVGVSHSTGVFCMLILD